MAATLLIAGSANDAGAFTQRIDAECAPLVVLAFRGSGEGNLTPGVETNAGAPHRYGESDLVTNGWEGITLRGLVDALAHTTVDDFRADQIPVIPIGPADASEPYGYDAVDAITEASSIDSALTFSGSRLLLSATRGAEAATHLIRDYLRNSEGCPILPKFIVVGYSQGAMAARHTAELNPESVLGVVKIGDPYQKPDAPGVRADGARGIGIIRWKATEEQRELLDSYYGVRDLRSSICHAGDPICEFSPLEGLWKLATGNYGEHLDYYSEGYPGEAEEDAGVIARIAHAQWQRALAAQAAGEIVSGDEATDAAHDIQLRTVSLSFAGTPTLVSAFSGTAWDEGVIYEFDLDGDGVFETSSPDGTVWVVFDDEGPRTIGVRVTDPTTGTTTETTTPIVVAPEDDGEILFTGDGTLITSTPEPVPTADPPTPPAQVAPPPARTPTPPPATPPTPSPPAGPPAGADGDDDEDPGDQDPGDEDPGDEDPGDGPDPGDEDPGEEEPGDDEREFEPEFALSVQSVYPGESFTLTGSGLRPGSFVDAVIFALDLYTQVPIDAAGTLEFVMQIPQGTTPGTYTFVVQYEWAPDMWESQEFEIEVQSWG